MAQTGLFIFRQDFRFKNNSSLYHLFEKSNKVYLILLIKESELNSKSGNLIKNLYYYYANKHFKKNKIHVSIIIYKKSELKKTLLKLKSELDFDIIGINKVFDLEGIKDQNLIFDFCCDNKIELISTQEGTIYESIFVDNIYLKQKTSINEIISFIDLELLLPLQQISKMPTYFTYNLLEHMTNEGIKEVNIRNSSLKKVSGSEFDHLNIFKKKLEEQIKNYKSEMIQVLDHFTKEIDFKTENNFFITENNSGLKVKVSNEYKDLVDNQLLAPFKKIFHSDKGINLDQTGFDPIENIDHLFYQLESNKLSFNFYDKMDKMDDTIAGQSLLFFYCNSGFASYRSLYNLVYRLYIKYPDLISYRRLLNVLLKREFDYHSFYSNSRYMFLDPYRTFFRSITLTKSDFDKDEDNQFIYNYDVKKFMDLNLTIQKFNKPEVISEEKIFIEKDEDLEYSEDYINIKKEFYDNEIKKSGMIKKISNLIIKSIYGLNNKGLLENLSNEYNSLLMKKEFVIDPYNPDLDNLNRIKKLVIQVNSKFKMVNFNKTVVKSCEKTITFANRKINSYISELEILSEIYKDLMENEVRESVIQKNNYSNLMNYIKEEKTEVLKELLNTTQNNVLEHYNSAGKFKLLEHSFTEDFPILINLKQINQTIKNTDLKPIKKKQIEVFDNTKDFDFIKVENNFSDTTVEFLCFKGHINRIKNTHIYRLGIFYQEYNLFLNINKIDLELKTNVSKNSILKSNDINSLIRIHFIFSGLNFVGNHILITGLKKYYNYTQEQIIEYFKNIVPDFDYIIIQSNYDSDSLSINKKKILNKFDLLSLLKIFN